MQTIDLLGNTQECLWEPRKTLGLYLMVAYEIEVEERVWRGLLLWLEWFCRSFRLNQKSFLVPTVFTTYYTLISENAQSG